MKARGGSWWVEAQGHPRHVFYQWAWIEWEARMRYADIDVTASGMAVGRRTKAQKHRQIEEA